MIKLIFSFLLLIISTSYSQKVITNYGEDREKHVRDSIIIFDAQPYNPIKWGIYGDFNINGHNPDFTKLPGVPNCCPTYTKGSGTGFSIGGLYQIPLSNILNLQFRIGYSDISGKLTGDEGKVFSDPDNNLPVFGIIRHTIDAGLSVISLEPNIGVKIYRGLNFSAGFDIGILTAKTFEQKEEIVTPPDRITYADGTKTYLNNNGDIPNAPTLMMALTGRLFYELPLNENGTLHLVPQISYTLGLTTLVDTAAQSWKINPLKLGLSLKFSPAKPEEPPIRDYRILPVTDTISVPSLLVQNQTFKQGKILAIYDSAIVFNDYFNRSILTITETSHRTDTMFIPKKPDVYAEINLVGIDENGNTVKTDKFKVEEYVTDTKNFPLLNYIFFEENESELPKRYKQRDTKSAKLFNPEDLDVYETLPIYYDILNIIGARLKNKPASKIVITSLVSSIGNKNYENDDTPEKRAVTVKNYLETVWSVETSRIEIKYRAENLKTNAGLEKIEESRRVEITSEDPDILKPLFKISDTSRIVKPAICRFFPVVKSESPVSAWEIFAYQGNKILKVISADGYLPSTVDWNINQEKKTTPSDNTPMKYRLEVSDSKGTKTVSNEKSVNIDYLTIRDKTSEQTEFKSVERYSLILFDLDKSEVRGTNKSIVEFMKNRIQPGSYVRITGYTDKLGNPEYNRKLSETRAKSTATAMDIIPNELKGVGGSELLYDNSIPEGRFYCRTVEVVITTKTK